MQFKVLFIIYLILAISSAQQIQQDLNKVESFLQGFFQSQNIKVSLSNIEACIGQDEATFNNIKAVVDKIQLNKNPLELISKILDVLKQLPLNLEQCKLSFESDIEESEAKLKSLSKLSYLEDVVKQFFKNPEEFISEITMIIEDIKSNQYHTSGLKLGFLLQSILSQSTSFSLKNELSSFQNQQCPQGQHLLCWGMRTRLGTTCDCINDQEKLIQKQQILDSSCPDGQMLICGGARAGPGGACQCKDIDEMIDFQYVSQCPEGENLICGGIQKSRFCDCEPE